MFFYTSVFIICWSGPLAHRFTQYWRVYSDVFIYADAIGQRFLSLSLSSLLPLLLPRN
jgi:hypothetical protein